MNSLVAKNNSLIGLQSQEINYLSETELNNLIKAFESDLETSKRQKQAKYRYWIVFLFLRFTGARISEILAINERDIDFKNSEVKMPILKRKKIIYKTIPIPDKLVSEYLRVIKIYPKLENIIFKINRINFYKYFRKKCIEANIPENLAHPHVLRHTRAIELLKAGIPITVVQKLLGHSSVTTTAIYLQFSSSETKDLLKMKGLI